MIVNIFIDGGARGNPGPAGYGVVAKTSDNKILYQKSSYLGIKTNNEAEYAGLISALQWLNDNYQNLNINQVLINSDSQLLICQIQGLYKVKAENLKPLFAQSKNLLENIPFSIIFKHIPREENSLADQLANQAMDLRL